MGLGGSAAINSYFDRDIDVKMSRTAGRAVPSGRLSPVNALQFGLFMLILSVALSFVLINPLTALIIGLGSLLYIVLYTLYLKRRTPSAVLWGGLSGAIPALGGWSVYSQTDWLIPFLIFMVVFLWQPGHFWPLDMISEMRNTNIYAMDRRKLPRKYLLSCDFKAATERARSRKCIRLSTTR